MSISVSEFIENLRYEDIPEDVLCVMRRSLLDTIGVAAIGSTTNISSIVKKFAKIQMPAGIDSAASRLFFSDLTLSPMGAAMAGAFMGSSYLPGYND